MSEKHDAMWGEAGEEIASLHAEIERLRAEKDGWDLAALNVVKREVAAERERCVRVAEDKLKELEGHDGPYGCGPYARAAIESIIARIRAERDNKP